MLPRTDLGNAKRFLVRFPDHARYDHERRQWLVWDGTILRPDTTAKIQRMARRVVEAIGDGHPPPGGVRWLTEKEKLRQWALTSQGSARINALLAVLRGFPEIAVDHNDLDRDPWLLACENGTLNLRTCRLQPADPCDLITRCVAAPYEPEARSTEWDDFLADITGGGQEMAEFLARAVGYTLTGDMREECFFYLYGESNTGKSTFLEAVRRMLGGYGEAPAFATFLRQSHVGGPRQDIAVLVGSRMVTSVETSERRQLDVELLKQLAGRDAATVRMLYGREFTFDPTFTIWLAANDLARIPHGDKAIWRRIILVPFDQVHDQTDEALAYRLREPDVRRAILAWAVKGLQQWHEVGLGRPPRVVEATEKYRMSQNPLGDFVAACCALGEGLAVSSEDLIAAADKWYDGERPKTNRWGKALEDLGCHGGRLTVDGKTKRIWHGIGLA